MLDAIANESFAAAANRQRQAGDAELRRVCRQFETAFTAAMVKESLGAIAPEGEDQQDSAGQGWMEMAREQLGQHLGRQGVFGLAETLYDSLRHQAPDADHLPEPLRRRGLPAPPQCPQSLIVKW